MPLSLVSSGLLHRDDFNRADGAPGSAYTVVSGAGNWQIVTNRLRHIPTASNERLVVAGMTPRTGMVVQALMTRAAGAYCGLMAKWNVTADQGYLLQFGPNASGSGSMHTYRRTAGTFTDLGFTDGVGLVDQANRFKLAAAPGKQKRRSQQFEGVTTDTTLDATEGVAGIHGGAVNTTEWYDDFVACKAETITATGLAAGEKLRVTGPSMLDLTSTAVTAVEVGGTATVDCTNLYFPATKVERLSSADAVLDTITADVWGGDEYSAAAVLTRTAPVILTPTQGQSVTLPFSTTWTPGTIQ